MAEADANTQKLTEVFEKAGTENQKQLTTIAGHLNEADARAEKESATAEKVELEKKANAEKRTQILERMFGLAGMSHKMAERSAKLAKSAGAAVKGAAAKQLTKVAGMAGSIVDWLIKGAGLLALWGLFKWLSGDGAAMFTKVYEFVIKVGEWFVLLFTDPMAALEQLWNGMLEGASSIGNWVWNNTFVPLWAWFKETFPGAATVIEKLWAGLTGLVGNIGTWFWENAIKPVWEWLKLLWDDPMAALNQLATGLMNLGTWLWENAIKPFWEWVKLLFTDPKLALAQFLQGYATLGKWIYDKAIKPLWDWFEEQFPDAAAFIKTAWAAFMSSPIGEWIYKEVLEPFTKWLDLLFTDPTAAIDEMFIFFEDFGTWIFNRILQPLWDWIKLLFTDPTVAIKQMWTFFDNVGTWIFDNALKPFWDWFEGMFPDVAASIKTLWAEFTGGGDSIIGKIGTFLKGIWKWFKGMFVFDDVGGAVSAYIDFVFWPLNLVTKLVSTVWDYIKGIFGFKEDEAKLPDDFSIGKMITDFVDDIAKWFSQLFDFDIAAIGRSILGDTLYDLFFATDEEKAIISKKKEMEDLEETIAAGTGVTNWSIDDEKEELIKARAELAKLEETAAIAKKEKSGLDIPGKETVAGTNLKPASPLKRIPAQETAGEGGTGATITQVNAPAATVVNSSSTMAVASSSHNPVNAKYGLKNG